MQISVGDISEGELLSYLRSTSLKDKVDIVAYVHKVYSLATIFIARQDGKMVGVNIVYLNDMQTKEGFVTYIHVSEKYRHMDIGKNLLQEAMAYGKARKFESIALEVRKNNVPAMRLYSKLGFSVFRENDTSFFMKRAISQYHSR